MMTRTGQRLEARRGTDHPNWLVRRTAQLAVLVSLAARLALRSLGRPLGNEREKQGQFVEAQRRLGGGIGDRLRRG